MKCKVSRDAQNLAPVVFNVPMAIPPALKYLPLEKSRFFSPYIMTALVLLRNVGDLQVCKASVSFSLSRSSAGTVASLLRYGREGGVFVLGGRLCLSFSAFSESLSTRV